MLETDLERNYRLKIEELTRVLVAKDGTIRQLRLTNQKLRSSLDGMREAMRELARAGTTNQPARGDE